MIPNKDYEYALKLVKKNKIQRFFEKFDINDLRLLYKELEIISEYKYNKFILGNMRKLMSRYARVNIKGYNLISIGSGIDSDYVYAPYIPLHYSKI